MPEEKKTPTSTNFDLLSAERYRDAIKFLNENGKNYIEINVGHNHNHVVLRVTDQGDSGLPRFFVVNVQPGKGKFGASGYVYDCCCIDQNGSPILNQDPFVAKRFHKGSKIPFIDIQKESELFNVFYKAIALNTDTYKFLLMEKIPGRPLDDPEIKEKIKKLPWLERLELITQLCLRYNLLSHETVSKGQAIIHSDLHLNNILVDIQRNEASKGNDINVSIIDFGCAIQLEHEDDSVKKEIQGAAFIRAPEGVIDSIHQSPSFTTKSDVFSLVLSVLYIFGVEDPAKERAEEGASLRTMPFNIEGFLGGIELPTEQEPILSFLKKFIQRMSAMNPEDRASPDEILQFFNTLRLCELNKDEDKKAIYHTKLFLLASGWWDESVGKKIINKLTKDKENVYKKEIVSTIATFKDVDFESMPALCKFISSNLSENITMDKKEVLKLFEAERLIKSMTENEIERINSVYIRLTALTQSELDSELQKKLLSTLEIKNEVKDIAVTQKLIAINKFREELAQIAPEKNWGMSVLGRYIGNAASFIIVLPAIIRGYYCYKEFGTGEFWKSNRTLIKEAIQDIQKLPRGKI